MAANATGESNGESLVVGEAKPNAANTMELTSSRAGVGCSGTADMAMTATGLVRASDGSGRFHPVTARGAANAFSATFTTVRGGRGMERRDGTLPAVAGGAMAPNRRVAEGSSIRCGCVLELRLGAGGIGVVAPVIDAAGGAPLVPGLRVDLVDVFAPPVLNGVPRRTRRTVAPADTKVLGSGATAEKDLRGGEAPSVCEPAAGDVPAGSEVVVEAPSDAEPSLVPEEPAVPSADEDPVSSAHAAAGVEARAIPTPSVTANAPTRPMYFAFPIVGTPIDALAKWPPLKAKFRHADRRSRSVRRSQ